MRARVLAIAAWLAATPSLVASADDAVPPCLAGTDGGARAVFTCAVDDHVELIERQMRDVKARRTEEVREHLATSQVAGERHAAAQQTGARAVAIDDENVATLPRLAALAFKTDLKGAEAGVSIAPLLLLGFTDENARGLSVNVASLKDDKFRLGLSYQRSWGPSATGPDDLGLETCKLNPANYKAQVLSRADDYVVLCAAIAQLPLAAVASHEVEWLRAIAACGGKADDNPLPGPWLLNSGEKLSGQKILTDAKKADLMSKVNALLQLWKAIQPRVPLAVASAVLSNAKNLEALRDPPSPTSCIDTDVIIKAAMRKRWSGGETSLGVSVVGDLHPYRWGANPDENMDLTKNKPLPRFELARAEARVELRRSRERLSWMGGLGVKWEREALADPLVVSVRPTLGVQYVARRLDGGPMYKDGQLALTSDGALPPVLVLGVDILASVPVHNKPAMQTSPLDEFGVKVFADVRINKELAFRIGIPLTAGIKKTSADENVKEKALQWSLPAVFVSTVLEL
jgi:hypothetical protein